MTNFVSRAAWAVAVIAGAGALLSAGADDAAAGATFKTRYSYYSVPGGNARDLYQQMASRGPHVAGQRAFGATTARMRHGGILRRHAGSCQLQNYHLQVTFDIRLPKLARGARVSAADRAWFRQFQRFVKRHEERHRAIWIGCARKTQRAINGMKARTCKDLDRRATLVYDRLKRRCNRVHDAFDLAERKRLARHPLVRAARRVQATRRGFALPGLVD